ncbi:MAG: pseudouridine synthase [Proteobacteria bacterium]|nr:pseudouridine synthase [Pseudomonadota bacterium]
MNPNENQFDLKFRRLGVPVLQLQAGRRIDSFLAKEFPFLTRSAWMRRLECGEVLVNKRDVKVSYRIRTGDVVHFFHPEEVEPEVDRGIRILWSEGAVMAVYKPGNLPMHENGAYRKNTFANLLKGLADPEGCNRGDPDQWSAVHRLDRETSGIVLCGKTHAVRQKLAEDFEAKKVQKEYLCIVNGIPTEAQWVNEGPLGDLTGSQIRIKKWVVPYGLPAETGFVCEGVSGSGHALLRAYPRTGRTNQIRIHAAHSGHWILGDKLYHPNEEVFLNYWETGKTTSFGVAETGFHRCCLHAASLTFVHPETSQQVRIDSPIPEDMQDLWTELLRGSNGDGVDVHVKNISHQGSRI